MSQTGNKTSLKVLFLQMAREGKPKPSGQRARMLRHYASPNSQGYDQKFSLEIKQLAPSWFQDLRKQKMSRCKKELLRLAHSGAKKPTKKNKNLSNSLWRYISPLSSRYDENFVREIRVVAPSWLEIRPKRFSDKTIQQKKNEILSIAKSGGPRPSKRQSGHGRAIWQFTSDKSKWYDETFATQLKGLAPHWFVYPKAEEKTESKRENQARLLKMAEAGKPRPKRADRDERLLRSYISKKSKTYDEAFAAKIKKIAPSWVVVPYETQRTNLKKRLLDLASNGAKKPAYRDNVLGRRLSDFTDKLGRYYDKEFTIIIKKLAPHWFVSKTQKDKEILLETARSGQPRPVIRRNSIGWRFYLFTNTKSKMFDSKFTNELRSIREDWFVSNVTMKKNELYMLAAKKMSRPSVDTSLGMSLVSYTQVSSKAYDKYFTAEIKKLAPQWFRKKD